MNREVRHLSPIAKRAIKAADRACVLTEAWAKGMTQAGHEFTADDYADVYAIALQRAKAEGGAS